jgi:DNA-binding NarL/FixJ family response regulator
MIAQGMSNKEIALHLSIAEGTTKIHTAALLRALGARHPPVGNLIRLVREAESRNASAS